MNKSGFKKTLVVFVSFPFFFFLQKGKEQKHFAFVKSQMIGCPKQRRV